MRIATPSSYRTFTDYSLPVSRRTSNPVTPANNTGLTGPVSRRARTRDMSEGWLPKSGLRPAKPQNDGAVQRGFGRKSLLRLFQFPFSTPETGSTAIETGSSCNHDTHTHRKTCRRERWAGGNELAVKPVPARLFGRCSDLAARFHPGAIDEIDRRFEDHLIPRVDPAIHSTRVPKSRVTVTFRISALPLVTTAT
jgi:hypothetical protein